MCIMWTPLSLKVCCNRLHFPSIFMFIRPVFIWQIYIRKLILLSPIILSSWFYSLCSVAVVSAMWRYHSYQCSINTPLQVSMKTLKLWLSFSLCLYLPFFFFFLLLLTIEALGSDNSTSGSMSSFSRSTINDSSKPYYLHHSDSPGLVLVS